jgi:hypothetical protein
LGLDSATELYGMDKAMIDSVYKRLVKDAEDITIPEERRPRSTVKVMGALTTVVSAVRYYADRGVPLTIELLETMHHRKAVNFYNRFSQGRRRLKAVETAKGGDDSKQSRPPRAETTIIPMNGITPGDSLRTLSASQRPSLSLIGCTRSIHRTSRQEA